MLAQLMLVLEVNCHRQHLRSHLGGDKLVSLQQSLREAVEEEKKEQRMEQHLPAGQPMDEQSPAMQTRVGGSVVGKGPDAVAHGGSADHAERKRDSAILDSAQVAQFKFEQQVIALLTAFMFAFFLVHVGWNLQHHGLHMVKWYVLILAPLFAVLFVLLPIAVARFSLVQAYFVPDPEVLDAVFERCFQFEHDLRFMWRLIGRRGEITGSGDISAR